MPMGMRLVAVAALVLATIAVLQHAQVKPLSATQQVLQHHQQQLTQRQQWRNQNSKSYSVWIKQHVRGSRQATSEEAEPSSRSLMEVSSDESRSTGYGYGYGYGYGGYSYGGDVSLLQHNGRHLLQQQVGMNAPRIVYDDEVDQDAQQVQQQQHLEAVVAAGISHQEAIELDSAAVLEIGTLVTQPMQQRVARKLLLNSSHFEWQLLEQLAAPVHIELQDDLLPVVVGRSLMANVDGADAVVGSYGYGGYGSYGYGGYGYGAGGARRLMHAAEADDVQLYNAWMLQHNYNPKK